MCYRFELEWLPAGFHEAIEEAMACATLDRKEALRRQISLAPICDGLFLKVQNFLGMPESDIVEEYLRPDVHDQPQYP